MTRPVRKIQCLERLIETTQCLESILIHLVEDKIIDDDCASRIRMSSSQADELHIALENARKSEKILLLDYEWTILPVEQIRVLMVTDRTQKEFLYNRT